MQALLSALSELLAAVLGALGFVGRPRRRSEIRKDLELLRDLETFEDLGQGTSTHGHLKDHIALEVDRLAGIAAPQRTIQWGSIFLAALIGLSLAYLTYTLNEDGFDWWSLIPGFVAFLMLGSIIGMLNPDENGQ